MESIFLIQCNIFDRKEDHRASMKILNFLGPKVSSYNVSEIVQIDEDSQIV